MLTASRYYIYSPSSALQTCPLAMTDGAARLLEAYSHTRPSSIPTTPSTQPIYFNHSQQPGVEQVFQDAYAKLTSRGEPGRGPERWTSGQWMTERPGGSDVSNTETVAVYSPLTSQQMGEMGISEHQLGPWVIDGYKFFSSATDADMTILLAKTEGAKGLSAFYAPLKRKRLLMPREGMELESHDFEEDHDQEWNGVSVVRLKKKLGTRPVATGEIEVQGMRGWLVSIFNLLVYFPNFNC